MRKIQNRIEKKGHGFIVNEMANKEYYKFCQPSFLYSYLKLTMTGKKDTYQNWHLTWAQLPPPPPPTDYLKPE